MAAAALLVIDMQKFFFEENRDVDQQRLAGSCREIIDISRAAGLPVINVVTEYREDRLDWPRAWREDPQAWCASLAAGNNLTDLVNGIVIQPTDPVVRKKRFSAFYNTDLDDILRSLGCTQVYVIGYSADVCVRFTSVDAYNRGYRVRIIYEGVESFRESKENSIAYLEWLIDAERLSLTDYREIMR